jgi:hypothetical protein
MAFTQVALTGKVLLSNSSPAAGASVTLTLNTPITDGVEIVAPAALAVRCASDGSFSLTVNANDDTTTQPTGTYYSVVIGYGSQTIDSFNVVVLHADAPTVNLFTLATLPNPNVVSPYVSQIVAGTGVSLSPTGGTGAVTVNATGGGGTVTITSPDNSIIVGGTTSAPTLEAVTTPTGQEFINVLATPFSNQHFNTIAQSSGDYFGGELQADGTQNAEVVFQKYLQAGTYTMDLFQKMGATHGIITIFIDGVQLGTTVDGYSASGAETRSTIANITITGSTVHSIRLLVSTHNASATTPFYIAVIHGIAMTRTGS